MVHRRRGLRPFECARTTLTDARERLHLHTWQLQQLLPSETGQAGS